MAIPTLCDLPLAQTHLRRVTTKGQQTPCAESVHFHLLLISIETVILIQYTLWDSFVLFALIAFKTFTLNTRHFTNALATSL